ncbi:MAG: S-layer homology domain-containing protein, partial [bacterium]
VEGYPDGTFKGNQPLTRYEMAMVVARIIARIEAIPTPPPPEVRRADLDAVRRDLAATRTQVTTNQRTIATLQRLVNEFRAELQALGVRVTALEEELSALRARLDNTRITGDFIHWYNAVGGGLSAPGRQEFSRIRLTYSGRVAEGVSTTLRVRSFAVGGGTNVDYDRLHLDWANAFGVEGLSVRVGRHTVNLGPIGLLLNMDTNNQRRDGVSARWRLGSLDLLGAAFQRTIAATDHTVLAGRLSLGLIPGWTIGLNVRNDQATWTPGPTGTGFSGDLSGELVSGLSFAAEYASFDTTGIGTRTWLEARVDLNFGQLAGTEIPFNPRLRVFYREFGNTAGTPLGVLTGNYVLTDAWFGDFGGSLVSDARGFGARLDLQLLENLTATLTYERYDRISVTGSGTVMSARLGWTVAPRTIVNIYAASGEGGQFGLPATAGQAAGVYVTTSW